MQRQNTAVIKQTRKGILHLTLPILGITALFLHGCNQISRQDEIRPADTNVTSKDVGNVSNNDSLTIGKEVTIRNQVTKAIDQNGFVMQSNGASPILVLNATGAPFTLPNKDIPVQATGMVEAFVPADVQRKYGLNLNQSLYQNYNSQPTIIAKSLALAPTPEDLATTPTGYFDRTIAVKGQVRKIDSASNTPKAMALFEDGWADDVGVLVVGINQQNGRVQEGEYVVVTGTARQPDANLLEKELGWDTNKTQEFISRYKNRPVIVAEYVFPSAVPTQQ